MGYRIKCTKVEWLKEQNTYDVYTEDREEAKVFYGLGELLDALNRLPVYSEKRKYEVVRDDED